MLFVSLSIWEFAESVEYTFYSIFYYLFDKYGEVSNYEYKKIMSYLW